jgi:hypothetical protein
MSRQTQDPFKGRDVNKEADNERGEREQKEGVPETTRDPKPSMRYSEMQY